MELVISYDTPLSLKELSRHLPRRPRRMTVWRWVRDGIRSRDLVVVKLEAFGQPLQSTLENYWKMQLRLDPGGIALLSRYDDGRELCLSMCGVCEKFHRFDVDRLQIRDEALHSQGWRRHENHTWVCGGCV